MRAAGRGGRRQPTANDAAVGVLAAAPRLWLSVVKLSPSFRLCSQAAEMLTGRPSNRSQCRQGGRAQSTTCRPSDAGPRGPRRLSSVLTIKLMSESSSSAAASLLPSLLQPAARRPCCCTPSPCRARTVGAVAGEEASACTAKCDCSGRGGRPLPALLSARCAASPPTAAEGSCRRGGLCCCLRGLPAMPASRARQCAAVAVSAHSSTTPCSVPTARCSSWFSSRKLSACGGRGGEQGL